MEGNFNGIRTNAVSAKKPKFVPKYEKNRENSKKAANSSHTKPPEATPKQSVLNIASVRFRNKIRRKEF